MWGKQKRHAEGRGAKKRRRRKRRKIVSLTRGMIAGINGRWRFPHYSLPVN
jgi:hypothetical protein